MHIIALCGVGGTGKTTTLKKLIGTLNKQCKVEGYGLLHPIAKGDEHLENASLEEMLKSQTDVWAVFNYGGKRVGITSQGDERKYLKEAFEHFEKCDISMCAVRSEGETKKFVKDKTNNSNGKLYIYRHIAVECPENERETLYDEVNLRQATFLKEKLESLI